MRPYGTQSNWKIGRRQAIRLSKAGKNLPAIARAFECFSEFSIPMASDLPREGGSRLKPPTDARPSSQADQSSKKPSCPGPPKRPSGCRVIGPIYGPSSRVAKVIHKQFGVQYHPSHVWKLLVGLGWSCQKPERRALQRDEEEIAHWNRYRWPHIKKRRQTWGPSGLP